MHCLPASEAMHLLFCTCPKNVYGFFTADPYPTIFDPFLPMVDEVPDYTGCVDENERKEMAKSDKSNARRVAMLGFIEFGLACVI